MLEKSAVTCDDEVSFLTHFSDIYFGFTGERRDEDILSKNGNKPIFFSISTHNNDIVCIQEQDFVDEFTLQRSNLHP